MSTYNWITIFPQTYNTSQYVHDISSPFEHQFNVNYEDWRPIKLLRIDIQDRFYLKEYSLIYLETGEIIKGIDIGDKFFFRLIFPAKKGAYKLVTKGGKYCYSVLMLESTLELTDEPICKARSPFNILVSCPIKNEPLYKQITYRKVGATEWENIGLTTDCQIPVDVDPTWAYEVKMKLAVPDLFETEYTPITTTTVHQNWANQRRPNIDFFDTTLQFQICMQCWLSNVSMTLRYKRHGEENWSQIEKAPYLSNVQYQLEELGRITWSLEDRLYDQLIEDDMTIDWQLVFKNIATNQIVETDIRTEVLHKRNKVATGESLTTLTRFVRHKNASSLIYLCPDGQFWFTQDIRQYAANRSVIGVDQIGFNGRYILKRKQTSNIITLLPKFHIKLFEPYEYDNLSTMLLPELVKLIIGYVVTPPYQFYTNTLKHLVEVNRVCKHWFNLFAKVQLQVKGELSDNYGPNRRTWDDDAPLNFDDWLSDFKYSSTGDYFS